MSASAGPIQLVPHLLEPRLSRPIEDPRFEKDRLLPPLEPEPSPTRLPERLERSKYLAELSLVKPPPLLDASPPLRPPRPE